MTNRDWQLLLFGITLILAGLGIALGLAHAEDNTNSLSLNNSSLIAMSSSVSTPPLVTIGSENGPMHCERLSDGSTIVTPDNDPGTCHIRCTRIDGGLGCITVGCEEGGFAPVIFGDSNDDTAATVGGTPEATK